MATASFGNVITALGLRTARMWPQILLFSQILFIFLGLFFINYDGSGLSDEIYVGENADEFVAVDSAGSSILNQAFWLLFLVACAPVVWLRQKLFMKVMRLNYFLLGLFAFCVVSLMWSHAPDIGFRRIARLLIVSVCIVAVVVMLPSKRAFLRVVLAATGFILLLDLGAYIARFPFAFSEFGFIGFHVNKNLTGNFAMIASILWIFSVVSAKTWMQLSRGLFFSALAVFILVISDSKTSLVVVPIAIPVAVILELAIRSGQVSLFYSLGWLGVSIVVGVLGVILYGLENFLQLTYGDPTLTGRTPIWAFMMQMMEGKELLGYGYLMFWDAGQYAPQLRASEDLILYINQGHNGYLDIYVTLGIFGVAAMVVLMFLPFVTLFRVARYHSNGNRLSRYISPFIAVFVAGLIHNITESSLLRADHMMWIFMLYCLLYISIYHLDLRDFAPKLKQRSKKMRPGDMQKLKWQEQQNARG